MAKWYGEIGYGFSVESAPSVFTEKIEKRMYYGDIVRNSRTLQTADKINDDINVSNQLSILSDPYACKNFHSMRYATFMGTKWKITNVEVEYPRLILTLGSEYHAH